MATIVSQSQGYYINASGMGNHPEYIHHTAVDGSNKYGGCLYCFPLRTKIGGQWGSNTVCGSRSLMIQENIAYTYIENSDKATIRSYSEGFGLYSDNMGDYPAYIHHTTVDSSNKYGGCWCCFPMRSSVGGGYSLGTTCGSRNITGNTNTAYTNNTVS